MMNRGGTWVDLAASLEAATKYVRTTRFISISSGTSGQVTLPSNSEVVLNDFGGTVDAVVTQGSGGFPSQVSALTAAGAVVATTFDASGNWAFTGTPATYPVVLVYRVRQTLANFDSDASDIWGGADFHEVLPPANGGTGQTSITGDWLSQYALLAGRSGGQSLSGGTGSGENLTLQSTSHATKGKILLGASSAYDGANARLGVGTQSPDCKLDIVANSGSVPSALATTILRMAGADGENVIIGVDTFGGNAAIQSRHANGTAAIPTATELNNFMMSIGGRGYGDTGYSSQTKAVIFFQAAEDWTDSAQGAHISFWTTATGGTLRSEKMRILGSGNVGIGLTDPVSKLHVDAGTATASALKFTVGTTTGQLSTDGCDFGITTAGVMELRQRENLAMDFYTNNTHRMTILAGGAVGIGTSSPTYLLDVSSGNTTALFGADSGALTRTDATQKVARIATPHYTNSEEPVGILFVNATVSASSLNFGGGTATFNAPTSINLYTAANNTTTTGTLRLSVGSSGQVNVSQELRVAGDVGGEASHNTITGTSDVTANSTGVGTIKFKGATSRDSSGFIKIYIGTTAYYVPVFSAIAG